MPIIPSSKLSLMVLIKFVNFNLLVLIIVKVK